MHKTLLVFHFIGVAMGLSVPIANIVLGIVAKSAAPGELPALMKFPPVMARVGNISLVLLWVTGFTMLFTKYSGFAGMPWTFHVKITAVVVLTLAVALIHGSMTRALDGDAAAMSRLQAVGKVSLLAAVTALVFAVITFAPAA